MSTLAVETFKENVTLGITIAIKLLRASRSLWRCLHDLGGKTSEPTLIDVYVVYLNSFSDYASSFLLVSMIHTKIDTRIAFMCFHFNLVMSSTACDFSAIE